LEEVLSGGHSIFFDLRFFAAVFLFDYRICRSPFFVGGLVSAAGLSRGCFIAAVSLIFKCPSLYKLVDP
jgi:hypothetical protein